MVHEIRFCGIEKLGDGSRGNIVFGHLLNSNEGVCMIEDDLCFLHDVFRETVGQYLGKDKHGKSVYQGYIVKGIFNEREEIGVVIYDEVFCSNLVLWHTEEGTYTRPLFCRQIEVVGNIYKNSKLVPWYWL